MKSQEAIATKAVESAPKATNDATSATDPTNKKEAMKSFASALASMMKTKLNAMSIRVKSKKDVSSGGRGLLDSGANRAGRYQKTKNDCSDDSTN